MRLADGCLFLGRHVPDDSLRQLVADGYPAVHIGRRDELEGLARVGADYVAASSEVVRRLAGLGHRKIVLVREDDGAPASTDREHGFRTALAECAGPRAADDPAAVVRTAHPADDITPAWVRDRLARGVTAFVAEETDTGAAWRALHTAVAAAGLDAPGDLPPALLGSPPTDLAAARPPAGFDIPRAELGAAAVRMLTAQLSGEQRTEPLVACGFRAGHTAGPPPGRAG